MELQKAITNLEEYINLDKTLHFVISAVSSSRIRYSNKYSHGILNLVTYSSWNGKKS